VSPTKASPKKTATRPPHESAVLEGNGPRRNITSHSSGAEAIDRQQLLDRLAHLRRVVPVFARELVSARRQAAQLRAENGWLIEQVRQLQRGRAPGNPSISSNERNREIAINAAVQDSGPSAGRGIVM